MARVVVLGADSAGSPPRCPCATSCARDEVILVDRRDEFVMGLRKTWHLLGMSPLAYGTRHLAQLGQRGHHASSRARSLQSTQGSGRPPSMANRWRPMRWSWRSGAAHDMDAFPAWPSTAVNVWSREGLEHAHQAIEAFRGGRAVVGIFGMPHPARRRPTSWRCCWPTA